MPDPSDANPELLPPRLLVKLRPSPALRAAERRANLQPLHDTEAARTALLGFGAEPQWFVAELPDGEGWELAHSRVADQLGVAPSDLVFAEPDLIYTDYEGRGPGGNERAPSGPFALGKDCDREEPQSSKGGKAKGPEVFGWHLDDEFTQLAAAREAVPFSDPKTRIAHLDTGYLPKHVSAPTGVQRHLERNFVEGGGDATDPGRTRLLMDNSGHGTGTLGILAGKALADGSRRPLGGAPEAEVVPLRVAPRVVLIRTSAFARALQYALDIQCDVASMSMGGLPSRAWRETVDRAYEGGICIVTAAGNNYSGVPTTNLVYPARYGRVIAVCGVMADDQPYAGLGLTTMEGNHGPLSRMDAAMAAYTPNIPWALMECKALFRLNGEGTSSATPQVAAAAALWFEKHKGFLARDWTRVEAVRHALFSTARKPNGYDRKTFGHGILRAAEALKQPPMAGLPKTPSDSDSFAFFRVITGLGIESPTLREEMFNLEVMQRWMVNPRLQEAVPDPDFEADLDELTLRRVMEALIEDEGASASLRRHVAARWSAVTGRTRSPVPAPAPGTQPEEAAERIFDRQPELTNPPFRKLRVFAVDPSFAGSFDRVGMSETVLRVRWEPLHRGPIGEYVAVRDTSPSGGRTSSVDLDDPRLLARDGWKPSEGNPHFHQQMVYAVAMKTIERFEEALGRPVLWRPEPKPGKEGDDSGFVQRLTIRPHAFPHANAYYSPKEAALLFGYFDAPEYAPGVSMPGSRVYTCLSHDIIAHETSHAILDGMQRRFIEPTNPDVLAFHEAFADIVALMQHFTLPGILEQEIARTRGDIAAESWLGSLAVQFGQAVGRSGGLREAIGRIEDGRWTRIVPDPTELARRHTPHARGAILVAAVFDAFVAIYRARTADLYRIYTGGTGVLAEGAIHPDLVGRLAEEAASAASHVLTMCIRALDYLPPVDVTFFEYLRALITADADVVPEDRYNYRVAFAEAFRRRGIYPIDLDSPSADTPRNLSVDTLRWRGLSGGLIGAGKEGVLNAQYDAILKDLRAYAEACFYLGEREALFHATREHRRRLHSHLQDAFQEVPEFAREVGLDPKVKRGSKTRFEVHELRRSMRVSPDGRHFPQVVVSLTQSVQVKADPKLGVPEHTFRGGSTLIVDLSEPRVTYRIVKRLESSRRRARTAEFLRASQADPLRALFLARRVDEPFAALHTLSEEGA